MRKLHTILTDTLGILLIIIAPLLGWLPGPGGIPMFIAGLTLLSINHHWAKKLLEYFKSHGSKLAEKLLTKGNILNSFADFIGLAIIVYAIIMIFDNGDRLLIYGIASIFVGMIILLISRQRFKKFIK